MDGVKILSPGWTLPVGVFVVFGLPIFILLFLGTPRIWSSAVVVAFLLILGFWRWAQIGVWSAGDHLRVVNFTRSHLIPVEGLQASTRSDEGHSGWTALDPKMASNDRRLFLHPAEGGSPVSVSAVRVMSQRQYVAALAAWDAAGWT